MYSWKKLDRTLKKAQSFILFSFCLCFASVVQAPMVHEEASKVRMSGKVWAQRQQSSLTLRQEHTQAHPPPDIHRLTHFASPSVNVLLWDPVPRCVHHLSRFSTQSGSAAAEQTFVRTQTHTHGALPHRLLSTLTFRFLRPAEVLIIKAF